MAALLFSLGIWHAGRQSFTFDQAVWKCADRISVRRQQRVRMQRGERASGESSLLDFGGCFLLIGPVPAMHARMREAIKGETK
jgi:hypothetical protein